MMSAAEGTKAFFRDQILLPGLVARNSYVVCSTCVAIDGGYRGSRFRNAVVCLPDACDVL